MTLTLTFAEIIANYLSSDPATFPDGTSVPSPPLLGTYDAVHDIYPGLATGGIYTRPLKLPDPNDNRGATPTAFSSASGQIRPSIVVRTESIPKHFQFRTISQAITPTVLCWFYGPSHAAGKSAMEDMRVRVERLIDQHYFVDQNGFNAYCEYDFNQGRRENHNEFAGSLVDFTRFVITTLRNKET
jgi:hypothetical protein